MKERRPVQEAEADGIIEGRNAVIEALRAGTPVDKIYLARGETDSALGHIASTARSKGIVVVECDRRKLDGMSRTHSHQGVIALAAVREYASVDDILDAAREKGEPPLIVVCDELSDPHNLGAVIRTAECAGAHGVIIPKRRSAGLTAVVIGICFLLATFFAPFIMAIAGYPPVTSAALVVVGVMMMSSVSEIRWDDYTEAVPAFLIFAGIPFSNSIVGGISLGLILYPFIKIGSGKIRDLNWFSYLSAAFLILYLILLNGK